MHARALHKIRCAPRPRPVGCSAWRFVRRQRLLHASSGDRSLGNLGDQGVEKHRCRYTLALLAPTHTAGTSGGVGGVVGVPSPALPVSHGRPCNAISNKTG